MLNRVSHHYSSPSNSAFATSVAVPINVTIILNKINYIYFIRNITLRISNYSSILINNIKRNSYNYKPHTRLLHPFPHYSNDITKKSLFRVYRARKNFRIEKRRGKKKKLGSSLRKERKETVVLYRGCTGRMKRKARLVKTTFRLFKNESSFLHEHRYHIFVPWFDTIGIGIGDSRRNCGVHAYTGIEIRLNSNE